MKSTSRNILKIERIVEFHLPILLLILSFVKGYFLGVQILPNSGIKLVSICVDSFFFYVFFIFYLNINKKPVINRLGVLGHYITCFLLSILFQYGLFPE